MEADGYHLETVDLGERAPADPPTRTEVAARQRHRARASATSPSAPPTPERAAAFFGALLGWDARPSGQGFHIENVSPPGGIDGSATEPGVTLFLRVDDAAALAERVRELGGTVLSRRPTRRAAAPRASTTRACPSPCGSPPPATERSEADQTAHIGWCSGSTCL